MADETTFKTLLEKLEQTRDNHLTGLALFARKTGVQIMADDRIRNGHMLISVSPGDYALLKEKTNGT